MVRVSIADINDLVSRFSETTLTKTEWTHNAHLIVALWHNFNYEKEKAFDLIRTKIKAYNISVGTANTEDSGYHETLTIFWMIVTKNFLLKNNYKDLEETCHHFLNSNKFSKNSVFQYYTSKALFSKYARKNWTNGDIKKITCLKT